MFDTLIAWVSVGLLVGLLYSPITLGLAWAFKVMNYADLTCEGTFIFSGAVAVVTLNNTSDVLLSLVAGIVCGATGGLITASIHVYLKVSKLLSGIITWVCLYSLSIHVLGGLSNLPANQETLFNNQISQDKWLELFVTLSVVIMVCLVYAIVSMSRWGRVERAYGDQPSFPVSLGYSPERITIFGLMFSNALIAIGGVLLIHFKHVSDVNMGTGVLVSGLASVAIAEALFESRTVWQHMIALVAGSIVYNLAVSAFYFDWGFGLDKYFLPSDVRLITGLLILVPTAIVARKKGRYKLFSSEW